LRVAYFRVLAKNGKASKTPLFLHFGGPGDDGTNPMRVASRGQWRLRLRHAPQIRDRRGKESREGDAKGGTLQGPRSHPRSRLEMHRGHPARLHRWRSRAG
jgi:hypothetical protein